MSEIGPNNPEEYSYHENLERLISDLEDLACREHEDYALGFSDTYKKSEPDLDFGGELISEVFFKAERIRESYTSPRFGEVYGDVIATSYQIGGVVANSKPKFESFPAHIQEHLLDAVEMESDENDGSDPWHEILTDSNTSIVVQYSYSHTIFSDGTVTPHSELVIYVDEEEFPIPETAAPIFSTKPAKELVQKPGELDMSGFEKLLDTESLLTLDALQGQLANRHEQAQVLSMFYDQIDTVRFMTQADRLRAVRMTINYLFEPKAA